MTITGALYTQWSFRVRIFQILFVITQLQPLEAFDKTLFKHFKVLGSLRRPCFFSTYRSFSSAFAFSARIVGSFDVLLFLTFSFRLLFTVDGFEASVQESCGAYKSWLLFNLISKALKILTYFTLNDL